jgi:hypothetical protein
MSAPVNYTIQNKAIDEYFKIALQGILAAGVTHRNPGLLTDNAMAVAKAAYSGRCEALGSNFAKKPG